MTTATKTTFLVTREQMIDRVWESLCEIHNEYTQAPRNSFKHRGIVQIYPH